MESIIPAGNTNLIMDDGKNCNNNRDYATSSQLERQAIYTDGLIQSSAVSNRDAIDRNGINAVNTTNTASAQIQAEVEQFGLLNSAATQASADRNNDATSRFGLYNSDRTVNEGQRNFGAVKDSTREILVSQTGGFKDGLLQNSQDTAAINANVTASAAAVALQNANNTSNIILSQTIGYKDGLLQASSNTSSLQASIASGVCGIEKELAFIKGSIELQAANNRASIELDAAKNLAQIQLSATIHAKDAALTAAQNASMLAQKIAECCCENKALILESSNKTDNLVRSLEENRLRDARQREHEELVALRLRSSLCPPPVAAVSL